MSDFEISLRAIGLICVLAGISCLIMGVLNHVQRNMPARGDRIEKIRQKRGKAESLSRDEVLDEELDKFELKLPVAGAILFALGMIFFIFGG